MAVGSRKLWAVLAAAVLFFPACGAFGEGPQEAESNDNEIQVGLPTGKTSFANSDIAVAQEKGFFKEAGLTVKTTNFRSGVSVVQGVAGGNLDVGASSFEPVANAHARGGDVKIIGSYTDLLAVAAVTPKDVTKPADLRGKNVGVQEVGAFREIMTRIVLESGGLTQRDVNYVPVDSQSYISSLLQGKIESAILQTEQALSAQTEDKNLHVLENLNKITPNYHYGTYFVSPSWLENNRKNAVKFLTAITKAHRFMYENKEETVPIVAKSTGFDEKTISAAYDVMLEQQGVFPVNDGLDDKRMRQTIEKLRKMGVLTGPEIKVSELVDKGPIGDAVRDLGPWDGDKRWR
ncbi:MAG: hypothetical protein GEU98_23960 [Pseudonocardiaceae bacterium]|nr:hypothetical protein [Pseudonocardiaceae bacterium]